MPEYNHQKEIYPDYPDTGKIQELIECLELKEHPEGGWFRETYRSDEMLDRNSLPDRYCSGRTFGTSILYLLSRDNFSSMHRLKSDEIFHFYQGYPVYLLRLFPDGRGDTVVLGTDLDAGHVPQCVVKAGVWQGLYVEGDGEYALLGTAVAPSFDFKDFEFGKRAELIDAYPAFADKIKELTHSE